MDREVSVADCKHYQRTKLPAVKYARSRETLQSFNQCLGPPSVQMSGLCRHHESYEHKDASRPTEKVLICQIVYQWSSFF